MSDTPEVSVIIPTYNREAVLPRAIDSVLRQSFQNFELIVVDDGSTDDTHKLVANYQRHDARVCYLHKQNGGVATAWNLGVAAARASWIALLDSDDLWSPRKLERQLAYARNLPLDTPACVTDFKSVNLEANTSCTIRNSRAGKTHDAILRGRGLAHGSTLMVQKHVYAVVGDYDPELWRAQDRDWLLRYSRHYKMAVMPKVLSRVMAGSIVASERQRDSWKKLAVKHGMHLRHAYSSAERKEILASTAWCLARFEYGHRHYGATAKNIADFVRANPRRAIGVIFQQAREMVARRMERHWNRHSAPARQAAGFKPSL